MPHFKQKLKCHEQTKQQAWNFYEKLLAARKFEVASYLLLKLLKVSDHFNETVQSFIGLVDETLQSLII